MGAYENPAQIIDKSGEILAQGFLGFSQEISKGVEALGKAKAAGLDAQAAQVNAQKKADQDLWIKSSEKSAEHILQIAGDAFDKGDPEFDKKVKAYVNEHGDAYTMANYMYNRPRSTKQERQEALETINGFDGDMANMIETAGLDTAFSNHFNTTNSLQGVHYGGGEGADGARTQAAIMLQMDQPPEGVTFTEEFTTIDSGARVKRFNVTVQNTPENREKYGLEDQEGDTISFKQDLNLDIDPTLYMNKTSDMGITTIYEEGGVVDPKSHYLSDAYKTTTENKVTNGRSTTTQTIETYDARAAVESTRVAVLAKVQGMFDSGTTPQQRSIALADIKANLRQNFGVTPDQMREIFSGDGDQAIPEKVTDAIQNYQLAQLTGINKPTLNEEGMPVYARVISSQTTIAKATDKEEYISDLKGLEVGNIIATFGKGDTTYTLLPLTDAEKQKHPKPFRYQVTEYALDRLTGTKSPVAGNIVIGVQGVLNHQGAGLPGS